MDLARKRGWEVIVGVEPDKTEDISDLTRLTRSEDKPEVKPRLPQRLEVQEVLRTVLNPKN